VQDILNQEILYLWSTPLFVIVIFAEMILSYRAGNARYTLKDTATNVYFALLNISLDLLMKVFAFAVMGLAFAHSIFSWNEISWGYWLFAFVAQDFLYYVHHYVDHHCRFFWAVHVTHHNSEEFNITTGFRSPVLQPLYRYMFFLPLALLGVEPLHIMFAYSANQIYGTLVHTKSFKGQMGWFGKIFVIPSHHRVHHAANTRYLDKNMGMVLIIWDKIFGTFEAEDPDYEPIRYGLTNNVINRGPVNIIFHEWKSIFNDFFITKKHLPLATKLKYIFMPPGWSHDGSTLTSKQMQKQLMRQTLTPKEEVNN